MARVILLIGMMGFLVEFGFPAFANQQLSGNHNGVVFAYGDSGENQMPYKIHRMMQAVVPPPSMVPERRNDSETACAHLRAYAGKLAMQFARFVERRELSGYGLRVRNPCAN